MTGLQDKVAFVTGGASGIGLGITTEFLTAGIKGVLFSDIDLKGALIQLKKLQEKYGKERVVFFEMDVCNAEKYEEALKYALQLFGRLDIVVNNAGILNEKNIRAMIDINLLGVITGTNLGFKYLGKNQKGNGGVIINTASIAALDWAYPIPGYSATKCAVLGYSRLMGHSFHSNSSGVKVLAICPGKTDTNIFSETQEEFQSNKEWRECASREESQSPEIVGRAAVYLVQNADSGTAWVIEKSKLYKVDIPDRSSISTFVQDLI